jgi:hypothetical protein
MTAPGKRNPAGGRGSQGNTTALDERTVPQSAPVAQSDSDVFASRRRFLIWACMAGFVGPERVTERILAELDEVSR